MKSDKEIGYIQGFYAALKGVLYITGSDDVSVQDVTDAIQDTLDGMVEDGDMEYVSSNVDELIEIVKLAEAEGREEELFEALDRHFGGK